MRSFAALVLIALGLSLGPAPAAAADDTPEVMFTQETFKVHEFERAATITVHRTSLPVSELEVYYETVDGSAVSGDDFGHTQGSLVFGVGATHATFSVSLRDDDVAERLEQVSLSISPAYGDDTTTGPPAILMILDDDPVPIPSTAPPRDLVASRSAVTAPPARPPSADSTAGQPQPTGRATSVRPSLSARQSATTPFELRVQGADGDDGGGEDLAVDPSLAILAGLLLAVVSGKVWFACRPE